uniref:Acanthoscurrin-2-like n=1 Tax=Elaeis guineensis var. tenera TaxID=51953 RepID=A0A6J0PNC0_ELAGV|nr:acanthoscurrin-2-like [Elaeis guineensis]
MGAGGVGGDGNGGTEKSWAVEGRRGGTVVVAQRSHGPRRGRGGDGSGGTEKPWATEGRRLGVIARRSRRSRVTASRVGGARGSGCSGAKKLWGEGARRVGDGRRATVAAGGGIGGVEQPRLSRLGGGGLGGAERRWMLQGRGTKSGGGVGYQGGWWCGGGMGPTGVHRGVEEARGQGGKCGGAMGGAGGRGGWGGWAR